MSCIESEPRNLLLKLDLEWLLKMYENHYIALWVGDRASTVAVRNSMYITAIKYETIHFDPKSRDSDDSH